MCEVQSKESVSILIIRNINSINHVMKYVKIVMWDKILSNLRIFFDMIVQQG